MTDTPEHMIWCSIKQRCFNPENKAYARYGGRGIVMCPEWRDSFERFIADVGMRPAPRLTLERLDNDKGYQPGNVRWATYKEQARNTRRNHRLTHGGETLTLVEWEERTGIKQHTIMARLKLWNGDVEKTLTTPVQFMRRRAA
jgi:hypothetical protein